VSNYTLPHGDRNLESSKSITLPNGVLIPIRPIQPDDVQALQRFHSHLSDQSIYLRFFGSMRELSEQKAKYFSHVDGENRCALVALDPNEPQEIIAVARFDREAGSDKAEWALIIGDSWQASGLGIGLTHQLLEVARAKGIRSLYGLVLPENKRMLRLFRSLDLPKYERREAGVKYIEVKLAA
jgi:RimJ/RimL family protein N-acetyltransferase